MLVRKFGLDRSTVSKFLSNQVKEKTIFEANKMITDTPEAAIPF
jgi:hypothetical protein